MRAVAFCAILALGASAARAQSAPSPRVADFSGPRSAGMGDAHRAVASGNDGIYLNPAGLGQLRRYALEFVYLLNPAAPSNVVNVSVVDSDTAPVATGAAYTRWSIGQRGGRKSGSIFQLAFGYPLADGIFFGWGVKYLSLDVPGASLTGAATDLSLLVRFSDLFSLAAIGYNLFDFGLDGAQGELPRAMAVAGAIGDDRSWRLAFDWMLDFDSRETTTHSFSAGGEAFLGDTYPVRMGWTRDNLRRRSYLTFGLGIVDQGAGLDLAYKRQISGTLEGGKDHQFVAAIRLQLK